MKPTRVSPPFEREMNLSTPPTPLLVFFTCSFHLWSSSSFPYSFSILARASTIGQGTAKHEMSSPENNYSRASNHTRNIKTKENSLHLPRLKLIKRMSLFGCASPHDRVVSCYTSQSYAAIALIRKTPLSNRVGRAKTTQVPWNHSK